MALLAGILKRFGFGPAAWELRRLRAEVLATRDRPDPALVDAWLALEYSPRHVERALDQAVLLFYDLVFTHVRPACVNRKLFDTGTNSSFFHVFSKNVHLGDCLAKRMAKKAIRDLLALLRLGPVGSPSYIAKLASDLTDGLRHLLRFPVVRDRISVWPLIAELTETKRPVHHSVRPSVIALLFSWQGIGHVILETLYNLLLAFDDDANAPSPSTLAEIATAEFTPPIIIRRMVFTPPTAISAHALIAAAQSPHAVRDPDCRERILASDQPLAIDHLARQLSGSDFVRAIRRIRELGAWPSLETLHVPAVQQLDFDLIAELLTCPDSQIRAAVILNLDAFFSCPGAGSGADAPPSPADALGVTAFTEYHEPDHFIRR